MIFWTGSTIVLHHISNRNCQLKTFVENQFLLIHGFTEKDSWRYAASNDTLSDFAY